MSGVVSYGSDVDTSPRRFVEPASAPQWLDPVLVVCPRCTGRAVVRSTGPSEARLLCENCAATREWSEDRLFVLVAGRPVKLRRDSAAWIDDRTGEYVREYQVEEGVEPRFGVPLWLQTECCGGRLLWANNAAHLDYLEGYVGAELRDRVSGPAPLSSRLPAWMKASHNRERVMRALAELRGRLP